MKSKSRTFYRYILSYALVLFLPIVILFTLFSSVLFDRYRQEITESNTRLLAQMQENLDTQLEQLINISFMIQNNAVVNLRTNEGDVVAARKAVDTLGVFHSVSSLPDYLITYRSGTDYCFTSSSRIRPEKLFSDQLVYANHTLADFYTTVDRPENIVAWPADTVRQYGGQETEYITLFISVSGGVRTPKLRTAFLIPSARIRNSVSRITEEYGGSVQITDPEGTLLLGIGPVSRAEYLQAGEPAPDGTVLLSGEKHLLSSAHSAVVGWDYTVLIPSRVIEAPMRRMRHLMILLLIAVSAIGATAVYSLSNFHYKPLKRLTEKALSSHDPRPGESRSIRTDEMRQIQQPHRDFPGKGAHRIGRHTGRTEKRVDLTDFQRLRRRGAGEIPHLQHLKAQAAAQQDLLRVQPHAGFLLTHGNCFPTQVFHRPNVGICPHHNLARLRIQAGYGTVSFSDLSLKHATPIPGIINHVGLGDGHLQIFFRQQPQIGSRSGSILYVEADILAAGQLRQRTSVRVIGSADIRRPETDLCCPRTAAQQHRHQQQQAPKNLFLHLNHPFHSISTIIIIYSLCTPVKPFPSF